MEANDLLPNDNSYFASSCCQSIAFSEQTRNANLNLDSSSDTSVFSSDFHLKSDNSCSNDIYIKQESKSESNDKKIKNRIPFTKEEDEKIKKMVKIYGSRKWSLIASFVEGRSPKQCRDRYKNYLEPGFFTGEWSKEEDELLLNLYTKYGPKWSKIAKVLNDRSSSSIKNRWKYFLCRQFNDETQKLGNSKKSEQESHDELNNSKPKEFKSPKNGNFQIYLEKGASSKQNIEKSFKAKNDHEILDFLEISELDFINDDDFWSLF